MANKLVASNSIPVITLKIAGAATLNLPSDLPSKHGLRPISNILASEPVTLNTHYK